MERYDPQTEMTETVGHYQEREMFGETGFLLKNPSAVTIIADEDNVEIYKVEKASLEAMFQIYPGLAGKFYKFLSLMIARRIRQREMEILRISSPKTSTPNSPRP
jgi:CRP-like cAMP-binding protein